MPRRLKYPEAFVDPDIDDEPVEPEPAKVGLPSPEAEQAELLTRALLRRAAAARGSVEKFFSFVMREEFGERRRLQALAHQRVVLDFVMSHNRCVIRMPPGFSKTFLMAAVTLWLLGLDHTARGAVISATQDQAAKPVSMVRDYIEHGHDEFPELGLVFPKLQRSSNKHDAWTQTKLVVERPPAIRDPSLVAVGYGGALPGSRLSWLVVDDILDEENTRTPEGRRKVKRWFDTTVLSRRDVRGAKIVVTNTPWHHEDLTYALEEAGWPTLTLDCDGNIVITNAPEWDTDEIRPSNHNEDRPAAPEKLSPKELLDIERRERFRLTGHDPDDAELVPLWPELFTHEALYGKEGIREAMAEFEFNQLYKMLPRSDEDAACKREWIEKCKQAAREEGVYGLTTSYHGPNATFTGVDLAIGQGDEHGFTALFTFEVLPDKRRKILDIEVGRMRGPEIVRKIAEKTEAYGSIARVENNAAQEFILQFTLDMDITVPVKPHTTGKNKADPTFGVVSLFIELEHGAWLIPNDAAGRCHDAVQKWIDDCVYYRPPPNHTGDVLMASWFAREEAKECGFASTQQTKRTELRESLSASLLAR